MNQLTPLTPFCVPLNLMNVNIENHKSSAELSKSMNATDEHGHTLLYVALQPEKPFAREHVTAILLAGADAFHPSCNLRYLLLPKILNMNMDELDALPSWYIEYMMMLAVASHQRRQPYPEVVRKLFLYMCTRTHTFFPWKHLLLDLDLVDLELHFLVSSDVVDDMEVINAQDPESGATIAQFLIHEQMTQHELFLVQDLMMHGSNMTIRSRSGHYALDSHDWSYPILLQCIFSVLREQPHLVSYMNLAYHLAHHESTLILMDLFRCKIDPNHHVYCMTQDQRSLAVFQQGVPFLHHFLMQFCTQTVPCASWQDFHRGTLACILQHGANPNVPDRFGRTPLFYCRHPAAIRILIYHGANIKHQDCDGNTALLHMLLTHAEMQYDDLFETLICLVDSESVHLCNHQKQSVATFTPLPWTDKETIQRWQTSLSKES
jgi:hypothetical protein